MKATVASVARGMTLGRAAELAAEAVRLDMVKMREQVAVSREHVKGGAAEGRPEYRSLRHALWKETLYERARRREAWQAFVDAGMRRRCEERQRKKDEYQAWLEAGCPVEETPLIEIPVSLLPGF